MKNLTKKDWVNWHEERERFSVRGTEGFTKDLEALEAHIKKLIEFAPKDDAGWPVLTALNALQDLKADHARFKRYLDIIQMAKPTH